MFKVNLQKHNGTKVVAYINQGTYKDSASYKIIKYARMIAEKPEGVSEIIKPRKYLRVVNTEDIKEFKPHAMPGKTQYIVLILDCKTEAFEEITVSAGSTASAYAMVLKNSVIKDNLIAYVYDTTQKPIKGKTNKEVKLDSGFRERLVTFVERCNYYYRNSYFWSPPTSASGRRYKEEKDSIPQYLFAVGSDCYSIEFNVRCSCRNVYASSSIAKNGYGTTLTTLKTILRKDTGKDTGCFATPEQQAS